MLEEEDRWWRSLVVDESKTDLWCRSVNRRRGWRTWEDDRRVIGKRKVGLLWKTFFFRVVGICRIGNPVRDGEAPKMRMELQVSLDFFFFFSFFLCSFFLRSWRSNLLNIFIEDLKKWLIDLPVSRENKMMEKDVWKIWNFGNRKKKRFFFFFRNTSIFEDICPDERTARVYT